MLSRMQTAIAAVVAAVCVALVASHRPPTTKGSCDKDFGSSATALQIADASISWSFSHYLDCSKRAVWMKFTNPTADLKFYVGVGVPPMPRFKDLRADSLIMGPGLPKLSEEDLVLIPEEVKNDPAFANATNGGGILKRSPADQSTCAHLTSAEMNKSCSVKNGRCNFFEPYGRTDSWRVLDGADNNIPTKGGEYYVAVWTQKHQSGKFGIAFGTFAEDFRTPMEIVEPACTRTMDDFSEKSGSQAEAFPVQNCTGTPVPQGGNNAGPKACTIGKLCEGDCAKKPTATMVCGGERCTPASDLWNMVNMKMHKGMSIYFTGQVDVDFVRGMIPHHQGAVDMCEALVVQLMCKTWGDLGDLEGLVHFCNHVNVEQKRELAIMQKWLADKELEETAICNDDGTECVDDDAGFEKLAGSWGMSKCDAMGGAADSFCNGEYKDQMKTLCRKTCGFCKGGMGNMSVMSGMGDKDGGKMSNKVGMGGMGGMNMSDGCGNTTVASSKEFIKANQEMHGGMKVKLTCNHEVDFVRGMIPHHSGAVVMCDILAANTKSQPDAVLNELCANITRLQRAEITWMSQWLVNRKHALIAPCNCGTETVVQPQMPCEDILSSTSFCHSAGGDFSCKCQDIINTNACGTMNEIKGFAVMNVTAECERTCGACPGKRAPLFSKACPMEDHGDNHSGHENGGTLLKKVIAITTTLEHLDYNKIIMNVAVKDALVKAITDAYLSKLGAGYKAEHISVTLSPGSVKALVKITPTGNVTIAMLKETVTNLKADLETEVLKKVKELPVLADFVEAGMTLADVTATSTAPVEASGTSEPLQGMSSSCHSQWTVLMFILLQVITSTLL